jgi:hypothetical protein
MPWEPSSQNQRVILAEPREHRRVGIREALGDLPRLDKAQVYVFISLEQARQSREHPQPGLRDAVVRASLQEPAAAGDPAHRRSQVASEEEPAIACQNAQRAAPSTARYAQPCATSRPSRRQPVRADRAGRGNPRCRLRWARLGFVATADNGGWSLYGAQRSQRVATAGKWEDAENGADMRNPLPWVATGCVRRSMVRRGSTVRVRQRALQKPRKSRLFRSARVARAPVCGGYGAGYGAFRFKRPLTTPRIRTRSRRLDEAAFERHAD